MQETAPFVSGPVRHRPRLSSSEPHNKSFICILKLIHNLGQEGRKEERKKILVIPPAPKKTHLPDFFPHNAVIRQISYLHLELANKVF